MRALRLLAAAGALVALALIAAWLAPPLLDWDRYRATIAAAASAGLGRPVRIDGAIHLSLLPQATLRAGAVSLADTGDGASATMKEMRLRVALGPLLAGRIEPTDMVLHGLQLRLPWPLAATRPAKAMAGLRARVEDGTLVLGALAVTGIEGELSVDAATGTLAAAGVGAAMGRPWRMTGRLGRAGPDGSAPVEVSLDGQGSTVGTGAALSGQLAADGTLKGRITGRGPDLSLLLTAPKLPWRADGQLAAGSGLVVADDLELEIGGVPGRGAVALRLLPQLRLDAALAASRLDLDAWLPPLLHGGTALPTGIDLQAEAATLWGGALRRLRAGFEVSSGGVTLREADMVAPGDAALHLSGVLAAGRFTGAARLAAPDLAQTLAWLRPHAPALVDALPAGALRAAELEAAVGVDGEALALQGLHGTLNGAPVSGVLEIRGGHRPALAADLALTGPDLDPFLPAGPAALAGVPGRFAGFDASLVIDAERPVVRGAVLDRLTMAARVEAGALTVARAAVTGPGVSSSLSGSIAPDGAVTDGRFELRLAQTDALGARLPTAWTFARPLFRGPGALAASVSGRAAALSVTATADLADARLQLNGRADLPGRGWRGGVSLHHPGAVRLLFSLGAEVADWLGDGSLSAQADLDWRGGRVAVGGLEMSAGALRAAGDLVLSGLDAGAPALSGALTAETLPLPPLRAHSADPLPLNLLHAVDATLSVHADHVLAGLAPLLEDASARLRLSGGALLVDGLAAHVSGGALSGRAALDAGAPPETTAPRLRVSGVLSGAALDGGLAGAQVDLVSGVADVAIDLSGAGYSPAGMLATLAGSARLTVRDGALSGLDAGRVLAALDGPGAPQAMAIADALQSGATPFTRMDLSGTVTAGTLTLDHGAITAPAGAIAISGSGDLPGESVDLRLALRPAAPGAPALGLRLIGPAAAPSRTPELADLARWLAAR